MSAWLLEPFQYAFFGCAMIAGVLIGAMCGALSVFVVLRRMSYIGHGLAHSVLGDVAVGVAVGLDLYVGAVAAIVVSALLIDRVTRRRGLHADAAIGIVTTAVFAIGVGTLSVVPSRINVEALLFGNILGVDRTDLWVAAGMGPSFLVLLVTLYKRLVFTTFDPEVAGVHGVRTALIELLFSLITAAVVVASVRVLGVLPIAAAVVIPAAVSRLVAHSFGATPWLATAIGMVSSVVGLSGSFYVDVPSGPTIVLTGGVREHRSASPEARPRGRSGPTIGRSGCRRASAGGVRHAIRPLTLLRTVRIRFISSSCGCRGSSTERFGVRVSPSPTRVVLVVAAVMLVACGGSAVDGVDDRSGSGDVASSDASGDADPAPEIDVDAAPCRS